MPSIFVNQYLTLTYSVYGSSRDTVVLLHSMKSNSLIWLEQIPFIVALGYRVITMDLRGFGKSALNPTVMSASRDSSMPAEAIRELLHPRHFMTDLFKVLDAENVPYGSTSVICLALGGWAGLPAVLSEPQRFRSIVLCCSPGGLITEEIKAELNTCDKIEADFVDIRSSFSGPCTNTDFAAHLEDLELAPGFATRKPARALLYRSIAQSNPDFHHLVDYGSLLREVIVTPIAAGKCKVPCLIVTGAEDRAWSVSALHKVASFIRGAEVVDLVGVGHTAPFEDPDQFNRTLAIFLRKHHSTLAFTNATETSEKQIMDFGPRSIKLQFSSVEASTSTMAQLVSHSTLEVVSTGHSFTEGPVWVDKMNCLFFSDIPKHVIFCWEPTADFRNETVSVGQNATAGGTYAVVPGFNNACAGQSFIWRRGTNFGNGSCLDSDGHLLTCEHRSRSIVRTKLPVDKIDHCQNKSSNHAFENQMQWSREFNPSVSTLISADPSGNKLTSPNDVTIRHCDGSVWFTDPDYGTDLSEGHGQGPETDVNGVYCYSSGRQQKVSLVVSHLCRPNGICFSPDERFLYVSDSGAVKPGGDVDASLPSCVWRFRVLDHKNTPEAGPTCVDGQIVVKVSSQSGRRPDGLEVDKRGRLYVCTDYGVEIFSFCPETIAELKKCDIAKVGGAESALPSMCVRLGGIRTPQPATNCAFGGSHNSDLFITAGPTVWRMRLRCQGRSFDKTTKPIGPSKSTSTKKINVGETLHGQCHPAKDSISTTVRTFEASGMPSYQKDMASAEMIVDMETIVQQLVQMVLRHKITNTKLEKIMKWCACVGETGEWEDLMDVIGLTHAAASVSLGAKAPATPATLVGPYYRPGSPLRKDGRLCPESYPGIPLVISGSVRNMKLQALPGASLEFWGANHVGLYDHEIENAPEWLLRGTVKASAPGGDYSVLTRLPGNYSLPSRGPTAQFLKLLNRTFVRAAHIHLKVTCPGYKDLVTQIYFQNDKFRELDSVRAVDPSLVVTIDGDGAAQFDIVLLSL